MSALIATVDETWPAPGVRGGEDWVTITEVIRPEVRHLIQAGHTVQSDPPATLTALQRWTCTRCGDAVLRYGPRIYGAATERPCGGEPL